MKATTLNFDQIMKALINYIGEYLFNILVFIFKPIVQFIYKKYCKFKKYSVRKQNRIKRELVRKTAVLGVACVLGIVIAFTASAFSQNIQAKDSEILHKYYTFYEVEPGDTLWNLADEYYELGYKDHTDYIDDVMFINHLENADDITCGDTLVIPYYSYEIK